MRDGANPIKVNVGKEVLQVNVHPLELDSNSLESRFSSSGLVDQ
jgi:hypothetical protein